MVKEKGSQRLSGTSQYGAIPLLSRAGMCEQGGGGGLVLVFVCVYVGGGPGQLQD